MPQVSHETAAWTRVLALLAAGAVYLLALGTTFGGDTREICVLSRGQSHDLDFIARTGSYSLFPPSRPCNADYDLIPGYITPTIVALLILAAVAAIVARLTPPNPHEPTGAPANDAGQR